MHCSITIGHGTFSESTIRSVEEFFCRIFSPSSDETNITDVRYRMFQRGTREASSNSEVVASGICPIARFRIASREWMVWRGHHWESASTSQCRQLAAKRIHEHIILQMPTLYNSRMFMQAKNLKCTGASACHDEICHNPYSVVIESASDWL